MLRVCVMYHASYISPFFEQGLGGERVGEVLKKAICYGFVAWELRLAVVRPLVAS